MDRQYGNFLNGLSKFERMLDNTQYIHGEVMKAYWFRLLDLSKALGLDGFSEEAVMLRRLKAKMMKVYKWPYHPRYNPTGPRNENSDRLDELHRRFFG